jgi:hypothetical protein
LGGGGPIIFTSTVSTLETIESAKSVKNCDLPISRLFLDEKTMRPVATQQTQVFI